MADIIDPKIQILGGPETDNLGNNIVPEAQPRELMITTDTNNLYVGKGTGQDPVLVADSTVPDRVQALENKTNSIFLTFAEDFSTSDNIDFTATTAAYDADSQIVRSALPNSFTDNFQNSNYLDLPDADAYVDTVTQTLRFEGIGSSERSVFTKPLPNLVSGQSLARIAVDSYPFPVFPNSSNQFVKSADYVAGFNDAIVARHKDSLGQLWTAFWVNAATTTGGLYLQADHVNNGAPRRIFPTSSATAANNIATGTTINIGITSDATNLYLSHLTSNTAMRVAGYNLNTGLDHGALGTNYTVTDQWRMSDILVRNDFVYIVRVGSNTGSQILRVGRINVSSSVYTSTDIDANPSDTTTSVYFTCALSYDPLNDRIYYAASKRLSTNSVRMGSINPATGSASMPMTLFNINSNGAMNLTYVNNKNYLSYGINGGLGFEVRVFDRNTNTLSSPYTQNSSIGTYQFAAIAFGTSLIAVYADAAFTTLIYSRFDTNTLTFSSVSGEQFDATTNAFTRVNAYIQAGSSLPAIITSNIASPFNSQVYEMTYLSPRLDIEVWDESQSVKLGEKLNAVFFSYNNITLATGYVGYSLKFITSFPALPAMTNPIAIDRYTFELPNVPGPGTISYYKSKTLIADRVIDNIMLEPIVGNIDATNTIQFSVSTVDNITSIINPSQYGTFVELPEINRGSQLKVEAFITRNSNNVTTSTLPFISGFRISTKNLVTFNDMYALQVNQMKMGLRIQTFGMFLPDAFVRMNIDTFENTNYIASSTGLNYDGIIKCYDNNGTTDAELISIYEDATVDGVSILRNALALCEFGTTLGGIGGSVNLFLQRGNGDWVPANNNNLITFTNGTPANEIRIKAVIAPGTRLYGWSYLYQ